MNEREKTLAAYKEYLLECANHDSFDLLEINKQYERAYTTNPSTWITYTDSWVIQVDKTHLFRLKKRTVVVNGQTVPAPMDREPKTDEPFWCLTLTADNLANKFSEFCDIKHHHNLIRAGWFDNEQDASEYFKALLGIK